MLVEETEHIPPQRADLGQRRIHCIDPAQYGHAGGDSGQCPAPDRNAAALDGFCTVYRFFARCFAGFDVYFCQYSIGQAVAFGGGQRCFLGGQGVKLVPECMQISHVYNPFPVIGGAGGRARGSAGCLRWIPADPARRRSPAGLHQVVFAQKYLTVGRLQRCHQHGQLVGGIPGRVGGQVGDGGG